jgi:GxxExxY protein
MMIFKPQRHKEHKDGCARIEDLANRVIGAAIEVHRNLGPGFLESVYEEAMAVELSLRQIPYSRQIVFNVDYKGHAVGTSRLDLLVDNCLPVELKAVDALPPIHTAQVLSYLKATKHRLALLINFNVSVLKDGIKRIVL